MRCRGGVALGCASGACRPVSVCKLHPLQRPHSTACPGLPALCWQAGRGDLWVTYRVAFPESITDEQRQQLRALFSGSPDWQRTELRHDEL